METREKRPFLVRSSGESKGYAGFGKQKILLYFGRRSGEGSGFMHDTNLALWGLVVVPVGLVICFGYALVVWLRQEWQAEDEDKKK
jgi:hypothetical protein